MIYTQTDYANFEKANEIAKRVENLGEKKAQITSSENNICKKVYKQLAGKTWRGCSNCWNDLIIITSIINLKKQKTNMEQQFSLKAGKLICKHGLGTVYGQKNTTDEVAIMLLKKDAKLISLFERYPSNWKELIGQPDNEVKASPVVVEVTSDTKNSEPAKEELQKRLDEMSKSELKKICVSYQYPVKDYEKLNKEKLIAFILDKQFE